MEAGTWRGPLANDVPRTLTCASSEALMTLLPSDPQLRTAVLDVDQDGPLLVCPMCHTPESPTQRAIRGAAGWHCVRCGQHWDARRLSAVAAYAAWTVERAAVGATAGERASPSRNVAIEQRGGRT